MHRHHLTPSKNLVGHYDSMEDFIQDRLQNPAPKSHTNCTIKPVKVGQKGADKRSDWATNNVPIGDVTQDFLDGTQSDPEVRKVFEQTLQEERIRVLGGNGKAKTFTGKRRVAMREGGGSLNVARYASGAKTHWRRKSRKANHPAVRVGVCFDANGGVSAQQYAKIWARSAALCQLLTEQGFAVSIEAVSCFGLLDMEDMAAVKQSGFDKHRGLIGERITIKRADKPLDTNALLSLSNPALLRVYQFNLINTPDKTGEVTYTGHKLRAFTGLKDVGRAFNDKDSVQRLFDKRYDIVFTTSDSPDVKGCYMDIVSNKFKAAENTAAGH